MMEGVSARVHVGNVGRGVELDALRSFLKLDHTLLQKRVSMHRVPTDRPYGTVIIDFPGDCPDELVTSLLSMEGATLDGQQITVSRIAGGSSGDISVNASVGNSNNDNSINNNVNDNSINNNVNDNSDNTNNNKVVHLDFSHARDVYQYRDLSRVEVVQAVRHTFGDDESRRLVPPRQRDDTRWTIETDQIEKYVNVKVVRDGGENEVATVEVKTVVISHADNGSVRTKYVRSGGRQEGDLLLTLVGADTRRFRHVSNQELTRLVVDLGVGRIKRAVQMQPIRGTNEPSGNKFVILENVSEEAKKRIPPAFDFGQSGRMWINYYGKPRRCYFCSEFHEPSVSMCPTEATVRAMEHERAQTPRRIKTYSDSTLRLVRETALTGDVDAMSGGTTGNVLNAIEVDKKCADVESVLIVAGQNELRRMSNREFIWITQRNEEQLEKPVTIPAPPPQNFYDDTCATATELL